MPPALASTVRTDPLLSAASPPPAASARRRRWEVWRSPSGQPPWARPLLLVIAALAALLYAWNIADAGLAPFYSVAVKSMSESWKAFFYGAFDPQATITIDKLAGSFLPQALSARIFGFHAWSLALPQVIEGVVSVLVMYRVVRRWAGAVPGVLAALIFALTPIAASMFGHSMEDGALTMCLVLAADSCQRAVSEGRLRSLLWAGFWVGLGFQAKMLQAWMVLPALIIGYLVCASPRLGRRLWHLAVFGVVTAGVSLSWILLYTFTPAGDRPYVDGSTNNSAWSMVFGYNGLERFGISVPGSVSSGPGVTASGGGTGRAVSSSAEAMIREVAGFTGGPSGFGNGWTKLLGSSFGPEIGWLFPLALLALICGIVWTWRARRDDQTRAGFVLWGVWLLTFGLIFSKMSSIPHTAYVASLAPALAALSAAGIVMFWRLYRAGDRRGWMLPVAVTASLAWATFLWRSYSGFLPWALWAAVACGVLAVAVMIMARVLRISDSSGVSGISRRAHVSQRALTSRRMLAPLVTAGLVLGVVSVLAAPATWASSVLDAKYAGSSFNASAGPAGGMGFGGSGGPGRGVADRAEFRERFGLGGHVPGGQAPGGQVPGGQIPSGAMPGGGDVPGAPKAPSAPSGGAAAGRRTPSGFPGGGGGPGGMMGATESLTAAEKGIYDYVSAHRDGASYLMAVASWTEASPYILTTGQEVMPMGGFSGSVPEPTLAKVQQLVRGGQLRFFLLSGSGTSGSATSGSRTEGGFGGAGFGGPGMGRGGSSTATSIESWVERTCAKVPAKDYGGTASSSSASSSTAAIGGETLYECQSGS